MGMIVDTLDGYLLLVAAAIGDAGLIQGAVSGLPGDYGRYALGARYTLQPGVETVQDALEGITGRIDLVRRIADGAKLLAGEPDPRTYVPSGAAPLLGRPDIVSLGQVIQILTDNVAHAAADPEDAIRILRPLATYRLPLPASATTSLADVVAARCRQAALLTIYMTVPLVRLTSWDQAIALLYNVTDLIDGELAYCGEVFLDSVYAALDGMRAAVVADILARGGSLAPLRRITLPRSLPAAAVAQQLYRTGLREEELVARVDPDHPLFMPVEMLVLAR